MQFGSGWRSMTALRRSVCLAVGVVLVTLSGEVAWAAPGDMTLVSRASGANGVKGNCGSYGPLLSADGRLVAFISRASDLTPGARPKLHCADQLFEVYLRDVGANATTLVSRASGVVGARANRASFGGSISGDGRRVAFDSYATNLTPETSHRAHGTLGRPQVFVRDLASGRTTLVSRASGRRGAPSNGGSFAARAVISADGRFVAFVSRATNLSRADHDRAYDVYVRDLRANTTTLVSRASGAAGTKAGGVDAFVAGGVVDAFVTAISADGRFVTFRTAASNLSPDDRDRTREVWVRDLAAQSTTLVSRASGATGAKADRDAGGGSISGDGRVVTFESRADNLTPDTAGQTAEQVYARDLTAQTTTLVSRADGANGATDGSGASGGVISADGRLVAFDSNANDLSPDESGPYQDVYVRDLTTATTTLASRPSGDDGSTANGATFGFSLSADGRFLGLDSYNATNLSPDDPDAVPDVFVRELGGPS